MAWQPGGGRRKGAARFVFATLISPSFLLLLYRLQHNFCHLFCASALENALSATSELELESGLALALVLALGIIFYNK